MNILVSTLAIGIGATVMMDIWGVARKVLLKQPTRITAWLGAGWVT